VPKTAESGAALSSSDGKLELSGELGFTTVREVLEPGRRAVAALAGRRAVLDLTGVSKSDSAGLALVVDWLRAARVGQVQLELRGIPAQMADIARLSGLGELMGLEGDVDAA